MQAGTLSRHSKGFLVPIPLTLKRYWAFGLAAAFLLQAAAESSAQAAPDQSPQPSITQGTRKPRPEPADLSSLLPEQGRVTLAQGTLEVIARNSSLDPILVDVARRTGTEIINLPEESPRITGNYGPGPIRKVLIDLMTASGYNFVMVGGTAGAAPTRLLLEKPEESRIAAALGNPPSDAAARTGEKAQKTADIAPEEPLGPGALRPTPADAPTDENDRIRRNLQRLAHIQEQQSAPQ
jgi:hypothetical protein